MIITVHAVERFRARWAGGLTYRHALRELRVLSETAVPLREKTDSGEEQWLVTDGAPIVLVAKRDRGDLICVTVLPPQESDGEPCPCNDGVDCCEVDESGYP